MSVVLQANVPTRREIFEYPAELVITAVGTFVWLSPLVGIHPTYQRTVGDHHDENFVTREFQVVPLAEWLERILGWSYKVVKGAHIVIASLAPPPIRSNRRC